MGYIEINRQINKFIEKKNSLYLFKMVSVQSTVDTGHEDMVHDAQMDYYGTRLATCSSDKLVKIFEVKDGTQTHVADLRGHEGPVWQVAWAHPRFGSIPGSFRRRQQSV